MSENCRTVFEVTVVKLDTLGSLAFEFGRDDALGFKALVNIFYKTLLYALQQIT